MCCTALSSAVMSGSLWSHGLWPPGSSVHGDSPGKNIGMGCHACLKGIFPTQGLNPGLRHCRQILYQLSHQKSPRILEWVAYPFSRGSSWPTNQAVVSCIAGGFFTSWAIQIFYFCCVNFNNFCLLRNVSIASKLPNLLLRVVLGTSLF